MYPMSKLKWTVNKERGPNAAPGYWVAKVKRTQAEKDALHEAGKKSTNEKTVFVPREYGRHQQAEAERWLAGRVLDDAKKPASGRSGSGLAPQTIATLAPKWLQYRYADPETNPKTYGKHRNIVSNWIVGDDQHLRIDDLDIETELTPSRICEWMRSIDGAPGSVLTYLVSLRMLFRDLMMTGDINAKFVNPVDHPLVRKAEKGLHKAQKTGKTSDDSDEDDFDDPIKTLSPEHVAGLLSDRSIPDGRKLRYLVALTCGLRLGEINGLTWKDVDFDKGLIRIRRQLDKIGQHPAIPLNQLRKTSKAEIDNLPNAITADPKKGSKRVCPMHPTLATALRWWHDTGYRINVLSDAAPELPIFPVQARHRDPATPNLGCFSMPNTSKSIKIDLHRLYPEVYPEPDAARASVQTLRRTWATNLASGGTSREHVGNLLGHGAGSDAGDHYIAKNFETYAPIIARMWVPGVSLSGLQIPGSEISGAAWSSKVMLSAKHS